MSTEDKPQRTVAVYFETIEEKKKLERQAKRLGISLSKLIKDALKVGAPIILQSKRKVDKENQDAINLITGTIKVDVSDDK